MPAADPAGIASEISWWRERHGLDPDLSRLDLASDTFIPRQRGDQEGRLAADDPRQAIEELYHPIKQAIAQY